MIDPIGMSAVEWTDRMNQLLPGDILPLRIDRPQDWRAWARHVIQSPRLSRYNPPNPDQFSNWAEWAQRFNQSVPVN